jgi:hypothetical protein
MSRPKPTILLTRHNEETGSAYEITEEYAYYIVLYKGNAFNLRAYADFYTKDFPGSLAPKYGRTCFANPAHCIRLANKLNKENDTKDFTVVQLRNLNTRTIK